MKKVLSCVVVAVALAVAPEAVPAAPDPQIPVTFTLTVAVPGKYWFKYALFDRDGTDAGDPGTEVWSENMDTLGPKRSVTAKMIQHGLGSIASPNGLLRPADFTQQLWAQAFRWRNAAWSPCSGRVKLQVQPYALFSSVAAEVVASPKVLSVPAVAFTPRYPASTEYEIGSSAQLFVTATSTNDTFVAPVQLPQGATLQSMHAFVWDDSTTSVEVRLYRIPHASPVFDSIYGVVSATDAPGTTELVDSVTPTPGHAVVDNATYGYLLWVSCPGSWAAAYTDLRLQGVVINYLAPN